jgi:hypothetical protein
MSIALRLLCAAALHLFCILWWNESLAYAVLSAVSFGRCYNLCVSDVCHEGIHLCIEKQCCFVCFGSWCVMLATWTDMNILSMDRK